MTIKRELTSEETQEFDYENEEMEIPLVEQQGVHVSSSLYDLFENNNGCEVKQHIDLMDVLMGNERPNFYECTMNDGNILHIEEYSKYISRVCCGAERALKLNVNYDGHRILSLEKPYNFWNPELFVFHVEGNLKKYVGKIHTKFSLFTREYSIFNALGKEIYQIYGNILTPFTFRVLSEKIEVGKIHREFSGIFQECYEENDNFKISFSEEIPVSVKSLIFSATFLIDLNHFERFKN
eukprot:gene3811-6972_t